ncbi:MAG: hypothetical protein LUE11_01630 [Clostridia bacterium]|nr:hypothetical protein [Clostridia bacterium]
MGILGELNLMVKTGQVDQLHEYLIDEVLSDYDNLGHISAYIGMNDPRVAGAYRRKVHHNTEISIASYR